MNAFSIRDLKAENWGYPFPSVTRATAMREIQMRMATTPILAEHAADFSLHIVGDWDDQTGAFNAQLPHHVCELYELVEQPEQDTPQVRSA